MLKMNGLICIGEKFSRKKSKGPPFGLKIPGNDLKTPSEADNKTNTFFIARNKCLILFMIFK